MRVYQVHTRLIGAALILLAFCSVSEARWFRGGYVYYYVPANSACDAPTNQSASTPTSAPAASPQASAQAVSSKANTYQVNKVPVTAEQPRPASSPAVNSAPAYAPRATSGGWNVLPRSSWDYGGFPPYH
jgi:hypothetical protein